MNRDDTTNAPGNDQEFEDASFEEQPFEDDPRYDDPSNPAVREEEDAAGQAEWGETADEFVQDEQPQNLRQAKRDPFADEGPLEDDYVQHAQDDHHDNDMGDGDDEVIQRRASSMAPPKQSSGLMKYLPYVGGGIALLALAFFGYQQFMGSSPETVQVVENQNTWDMNAQATNPTPIENPALGGSDVAAQNAQVVAQPIQAAPLPVDANVVQPSSTSNTMITPVADTAANSASIQTDQRIAELTQQLEAMKLSQEQLQQKLNAASANPPSMDENSKAATQALVDRIAQLEQKLSSSASSASSVNTPSAEPSSRASRRASRRTVDEDASSEQKSARSSRKASVDFMVAKKTRTKPKQRAERSESRDENAAYRPQWILRSAQPGSAWLSQGPYSSDLRRVVPGDKVQGLGTVTSVRQVAGRWVVEGTQGAVR